MSQSSDRRSSPILRRGVRRRQHSVYLMCHAGVRCEKKLGPHNCIRHIIAPMFSCTNIIFYTKYITSSFQIQLRYNPPIWRNISSIQYKFGATGLKSGKKLNHSLIASLFFFTTDSTNSYIAPGCLKPSCKAEQYAISLSWLVILVNHS